jgi:hypothetical protein
MAKAKMLSSSSKVCNTAVSGSVKVRICMELPEIPETQHRLRHVDIGRLTQRQANMLKRIHRGLEDSGATLANGRQVRTAADVVRYLLENMNNSPA